VWAVKGPLFMSRWQATLNALRAVFSDVLAAVTITNYLRTLFRRPAAASPAVAQPSWLRLDVGRGCADAHLLEPLSVVPLPPELLSIILSQLGTIDLARLAAICRALWCEMPTLSPLSTPGLVVTELWRRAEARGLHIRSSLPGGVRSWVPYLLKRDFHDSQRREAPLAVGGRHSIFVDREGRLHLVCPQDEIKAGSIGEPLLGHDWGSVVSVPPTLVPSMQDKRIVSVATGGYHCLALTNKGDVYWWGDGSEHGVLSHADGSAVAKPRKIEMLGGVESVAAGPMTSAAIDDRGSLFTWGRAWLKTISGKEPTGLGYELDLKTESQPTPKRVGALSKDRVVGVALGYSFTLAVTDVGAVFSFGCGDYGALGHSSVDSEVLPRRIQALAKTGQLFVAVAAGSHYAIALTEEGHVYGWGYYRGGPWPDLRTPQLVTELAGVRVLLVYAHDSSACVVTRKGELYTWGLGHEVNRSQPALKRVEALSRVKVVAAAICDSHTLVADKDGVVLAFGRRTALGLCDADGLYWGHVVQPTPIPNLCVRTALLSVSPPMPYV